MRDITPIPDRAHEPQAEPCARHKVRIQLLVEAEVCEGTEAHHLFEHCEALLTGRDPDIHEDILDELRAAELDVRGQEVRP